MKQHACRFHVASKTACPWDFAILSKENDFWNLIREKWSNHGTMHHSFPPITLKIPVQAHNNHMVVQNKTQFIIQSI